MSISRPPPAPAAAALLKPRLRGVSHRFAFFVALIACAALVAETASGRARLVALVFSASLVLLFGTSALYHGVDWAPGARARMRRLDHAAIFVLIAGGYTPLFGLVPSPSGGHGALLAVWAGAAVGVAKSVAWSKSPKWLSTLLYLGLGWTVTGEVVGRTSTVGSGTIMRLVAAGALYSVGAIIYACKRPDPWPRVFGYHEVFHALVVLASGVLLAHVVGVLGAVGAL